MAFNFDSGQFNKETTPTRLGNFEVPRWSPTRARPLEYRPDPKPISDINGHFLPGAPRGTSRCFGHFTGTWELPRKITRKVAEQLQKEPPEGRFTDWLNLRVQRPKEAQRLRDKKRPKTGKADAATGTTARDVSEEDENTFQELSVEQEQYKNFDEQEPENTDGCNNLNSKYSCANDLLGVNEKKAPVDAEGHGPYVPGSLTDLDHRHHTHGLLVDKAIEQLHGPQPDQTETFWNKVALNARDNYLKEKQNMQCNDNRNNLKLPIVNVSSNFNFAKKMHVGNLEHQPLPDTLGYRHLTKIGEHRDSDIVVKPYAIGWKGYGAAGPTCCTKMRVHRPKTCDAAKCEGTQDAKLRPCTSMPNLKDRNKKPFSLMDLAICWDFRPDNLSVEPKPPKHIDGSNGSKAPAVFTMVHTPKQEMKEQSRYGHSNPIFNQNDIVHGPGKHPVPYFEKHDMSKEKRKDCCDVQYCSQHANSNVTINSTKGSASNSMSTNSNVAKDCNGNHGSGTPSDASCKINRKQNTRPEKLQTIKDAWNEKSLQNTNHKKNSIESYSKTQLACGKLHQSSPNESSKGSTSTNNNNIKHKSCFSCNGSKTPPEIHNKEEYKFAFKAGNPYSVQSSSCTQDSKGIKMPKMRHPYTKKSYSIPTLAPPFSIWKDANASGYPEHWRLASVYQHAYKPPEQRRKPLISSIYQ